jgi:hypothetical protein
MLYRRVMPTLRLLKAANPEVTGLAGPAGGDPR